MARDRAQKRGLTRIHAKKSMTIDFDEILPQNQFQSE